MFSKKMISTVKHLYRSTDNIVLKHRGKATTRALSWPADKNTEGYV